MANGVVETIHGAAMRRRWAAVREDLRDRVVSLLLEARGIWRDDGPLSELAKSNDEIREALAVAAELLSAEGEC